MTKPGALKILRTLEKSSFVHRDMDSKQYTLGPALLRLGNVYREKEGISDVALPVLQNLSNETSAATYITIWENNEAFLLFLEESSKGPIYGLSGGAVFGDPIPIHSGASAKLLAAHQDQSEISKILMKNGLKRMGVRTITEAEILFREFASIREAGFSMSDDEYEDGLLALSVPIPDSVGKVRLALSISSYRAWINKEELLKFLPLLRNGAKQITYKLSFRR